MGTSGARTVDGARLDGIERYRTGEQVTCIQTPFQHAKCHNVDYRITGEGGGRAPPNGTSGRPPAARNQDWLALLAGRPIGLLQRCRWVDYPDYLAEMAPVYPPPPEAVTIDYLIGNPGDVGHGLGPAMISAFVLRTWADLPESECVLIPVNAANRASWRMLEKAGFTLVAEGELEPDNPIDDHLHKVLRLDRPTSPRHPLALTGPPGPP